MKNVENTCFWNLKFNFDLYAENIKKCMCLRVIDFRFSGVHSPTKSQRKSTQSTFDTLELIWNEHAWPLVISCANAMNLLLYVYTSCSRNIPPFLKTTTTSSVEASGQWIYEDTNERYSVFLRVVLFSGRVHWFSSMEYFVRYDPWPCYQKTKQSNANYEYGTVHWISEFSLKVKPLLNCTGHVTYMPYVAIRRMHT